MLLEIVERLCNVSASLLEIIDTQATVIEQSKIEEAVKEELKGMREEAREEFQEVYEKYHGRK